MRRQPVVNVIVFIIPLLNRSHVFESNVLVVEADSRLPEKNRYTDWPKGEGIQ